MGPVQVLEDRSVVVAGMRVGILRQAEVLDEMTLRTKGVQVSRMSITAGDELCFWR